MVCKYCGQPLSGDAKFCTNCGADLKEEPISQPYVQPEVTLPDSKPIKRKSKNISSKKTPFFWISKLVIIAALVCFVIPFMSIYFDKNSSEGMLFETFTGDTEIYNLSGKELIFGSDDKDDDYNENQKDLTSGKIIIAFVLAAIAIFLTKDSAIFSAVSAIFALAFISGASGDFTYKGTPIKEMKDTIHLDILPGAYVVLILLIAATVIAAIDVVKRKKMFQQELIENNNYSI